jgi:predicted amino acid dehydrogenase
MRRCASEHRLAARFSDRYDAATPKVDIPIVTNGPRPTADVAYRAIVSGFAADAATGKDATGVGSEAFAIARFDHPSECRSSVMRRDLWAMGIGKVILHAAWCPNA